MTHSIDTLWVTTSPYLKRFHQPLIHALQPHTTIAEWQYQQSEDEPCSLVIAVNLLREYIQTCDRPLHLIGHGTGGLVSLLYAQQYPQQVRSLTLLGVGAWATLDWIAHYYFHLQLVPYQRHLVLTQLIPDLFGEQNPTITCYLAHLLEQELAVSPSPHSLFQRCNLEPRGVSVPLLVCGSQQDLVVDNRALQEWLPWLKMCDRIWQYPHGPHFFHCFHPQPIAEQILDFWHIKPKTSASSDNASYCKV